MLFMAGPVRWPLVTVMDMALNGANLIKGIGWTDRMAASLLPALMIYEGVRILALKREALVHVMVLPLTIMGWFWLAWQGAFSGGLNLMGKNEPSNSSRVRTRGSSRLASAAGSRDIEQPVVSPPSVGYSGGSMKTIGSMTALWLLAAMLSVQAADNLQAFPPAEEGMVRYVLQLPHQADESAFKVELIVGKTVPVDEGNRYFFGGKIEEATIEGWGFPRYRVNKLGPMAGTRMAIDPNAPKVNRWITLGGEPYLIRYNSRLPIVVYVPEGVEVRYRIWSAGPEASLMEKG
jgi:ecotin